ncbi:StlD/DarB family beta-ketosynthase [Gordonia sp. NPDC003424]
MSAYITATASFLPGDPVPNDEMDEYLGIAGGIPRDLRDLTLANCGIKTRHYAIDKNQRTIISNTAMAAVAAREAAESAGLGRNDVELLTAATTGPDMLAPGHASMVHGALGYGPMEISTAAGVCSSGMMALKNAYLQVAIGEKRNAITVASEFASRIFKGSRYDEMMGLLARDGSLPLEAAFLRYMLSDGAGAAVIENRPAATGISLRIDWISLQSFANTARACMYGGSTSGTTTRSWMDYPTAAAAEADGALVLRQDLSLLPHLVGLGADEWERLRTAGKFDPDTVSWIPAHYSSERMKELVFTEFARRGINAGRPEKWYSNLTSVGNIGCAAIFVILDEMLSEGLIADGDTMLCLVPESGRFVISLMHLTAVSGARTPDPRP